MKEDNKEDQGVWTSEAKCATCARRAECATRATCAVTDGPSPCRVVQWIRDVLKETKAH